MLKTTGPPPHGMNARKDLVVKQPEVGTVNEEKQQGDLVAMNKKQPEQASTKT